MTLYTSYFARAGNNPQAVSIARSTPRFFTGSEYKVVAPPWELVDNYKKNVITWEQYTEQYLSILDKLGESKVISGLHDGDILLCYEKCGDNCHRHLLAKWLNDRGHNVTELGG